VAFGVGREVASADDGTPTVSLAVVWTLYAISRRLLAR
jgi:hypothetical protein